MEATLRLSHRGHHPNPSALEHHLHIQGLTIAILNEIRKSSEEIDE
jgi:hypothetical protein